MKYFFYIIFVSMLVISCKPDASKSNAKVETEKAASSTKINKISFKCGETTYGEYDVPNTTIYLIVDGEQYKVDDTFNCDTVAKDDFERFKFGADATIGLTSYFAGGGANYYASKTDSSVVVYKSEEDAMSGSTKYTNIGSYTKGTYQSSL